MKNRFLNYIYRKNKKFFESKINFEELYDDNSHYFDILSLKQFIGYIPKSVNEPALKIFEDYGEAVEKWTLWQSWYINRKLINDPLKISFYHGMMMYIKVLNTMSRIHKKTYIMPTSTEQDDKKVESPWIDKALEGIAEFKSKLKEKNENDKGDQSTEV